MRPEVVYRRTRKGRAWHSFVDGAETPVCEIQPGSGEWIRTPRMRRLAVHKECRRRCPWEPRLNSVMTEEQIRREIYGY